MKKRSLSAIVIVLLLFTVPNLLNAQNVESLLASAVENDEDLKRLQLVLESRLLDVEISDANEGFTLSLSGASGTAASASYALSGPSEGLSLSFGPELGGNIGTPSHTTYSLGVPMSYSGAGFGVSISAGITQPLNALFGWEPENAADMEEAHGILRAEADVVLRRIAVEREMLASLKTVYSLEKQKYVLEGDIDSLMDDIADQKSLFEFNEESHAFRTLEFDLIEKQDELDAVEEEIQQETGNLMLRTGIAVTTLPKKLPPVTLELPSADDGIRNVQVASATRSLAIADEKVKEAVFSSKPSLSLSTSVGLDPRNPADSLAVSLSMRFSMGLIDGGVGSLELKKLENSAAQARSSLVGAEQSFLDELEDISMKVTEFLARERRFPMQVELADLKVAETQISFDNGFISGVDLQIVKRAREQLEFDRLILSVDKHLLARDISSLVALEN